ncbi:MAG: hypothetical protein H3C27_15505 [Opitutaceae bacterium]|nr:hypothetical protein [Opitutaceae bacterium]
MQATLGIRRLMKWLWLVMAGLVGIHVLLTVVHFQMVELPWYLRQIFDVDEEDSFPTWFSAFGLLLTSVVLWVQARRQHTAASPWRWHWSGLALGFLVLSIDEIAGMHETLNSVIEQSWAVPGVIVVALMGGIYLSFLAQLDRRTAVWFAIAGALYVGGAVGVEYYTEPYLKNDALNTLAYNLWTAVEEGMEMAGVLLFLSALLRHMKAGAAALPLEFKLVD